VLWRRTARICSDLGPARENVLVTIKAAAGYE
jgi:hypothetical protein